MMDKVLKDQRILLIIGGSPTFPMHLHRQHVECSPGTFVFWDWSYLHQMPDEPFQLAALVITRVISIINDNTICVDLGHKSVAAEKPFPRIHFLAQARIFAEVVDVTGIVLTKLDGSAKGGIVIQVQPNAR